MKSNIVPKIRTHRQKGDYTKHHSYLFENKGNFLAKGTVWRHSLHLNHEVTHASTWSSALCSGFNLEILSDSLHVAAYGGLALLSES